jgi:hypothetical protein
LMENIRLLAVQKSTAAESYWPVNSFTRRQCVQRTFLALTFSQIMNSDKKTLHISLVIFIISWRYW